MSISQNDLKKLLAANIIDKATAGQIEAFFENEKLHRPQLVTLIFGVLGTLLVGLGIILILAHNWDYLPKTIKTGLAILLLVTGQVLALYAIVKKYHQKTWLETTAVFWTLMIGASISLIAQIYHISGDFNRFLITWLLLALPVIYLMRSSLTAILYIIGVFIYGLRINFWHSTANIYAFSGLFLLILPYYIYLIRKQKDQNALSFMHWFLTLTILFNFYHYYHNQSHLIFLGYATLFSIFYMISNRSYFSGQKLYKNAYKLTGILGASLLLIFLSFKTIWQQIIKNSVTDSLNSLAYVITLLLLLTAGALLFFLRKKSQKIQVFAYMFIWISLNYLAGYINPVIPFILINLSVLFLGIYYILKGQKLQSLWHANFGLILISSLIISRFFDVKMSFTTRGLLFLLVGAGFFVANYRLLKKQKQCV